MSDDKSPGDKLLSVEEMAERMGQDADWVLKETRLGKIPSIPFNARVIKYHWPTCVAFWNRKLCPVTLPQDRQAA